MRFFFYGTLLDPEVRRHVIGRAADPLPVEPAVLTGYRRVYVSEQTYPVVIPDPRGSVEGLLMRGLDKAARQALLLFETDEYDEAEREVRTSSRKFIRCRVFVASRTAKPSRKSWNYETWRRRHAA